MKKRDRPRAAPLPAKGEVRSFLLPVLPGAHAVEGGGDGDEDETAADDTEDLEELLHDVLPSGECGSICLEALAAKVRGGAEDGHGTEGGGGHDTDAGLAVTCLGQGLGLLGLGVRVRFERDGLGLLVGG